MKKWTSVIGYEGIYQVSSDGEITRAKYGKGVKKGRLLKWYIMHNGYAQVALSKNCKQTKFYVHRVVLMSFEKDFTVETVNHINGDKLDNRLENLEYMTRAANTAHSHHVLGNTKEGVRNWNAKLSENDVYQIRDLLKCKSHREISEQYGVSRVAITNISTRKTWRHLPMPLITGA